MKFGTYVVFGHPNNIPKVLSKQTCATAAILENGGRKSVFRNFLRNYTSYQKKFKTKNVHHNNIYLFCSKHFFDTSNRYATISIFSFTKHANSINAMQYYRYYFCSYDFVFIFVFQFNITYLWLLPLHLWLVPHLLWLIPHNLWVVLYHLSWSQITNGWYHIMYWYSHITLPSQVAFDNS